MPTVNIDPADVVICSHLIGGTREIRSFLTKLEEQALSHVILVESMASPLVAFEEFWEMVYGEQRVHLPAIPELMDVLWEMGASPSLEMLDPSPIRAIPTRQAALALLKNMLFIRSGNAIESVLEDCFDQLTENKHDGYVPKNAEPRREGLIQWSTGH